MFTQKAKEAIMKAWRTEYVEIIKLSFDINNAGLGNHKVTALVGPSFRELQFTMDWDDRQKEFTNVNPKPEIINVKILHLPVKAKWYIMQESGEKPEEYRDITPYWCNVLLAKKPYSRRFWKDILDNTKDFLDNTEMAYQYLLHRYSTREYTHVCLRYGYTQRCFINRIDSITIGRGIPEWGAPTDRDVFIIKHHKEPSPIIVGKDYERV